ncbi:MAG: PEPxxWA-CTERM sorting domain-containing protein, partial [Caulobacteraceae bacterium]
EMQIAAIQAAIWQVEVPTIHVQVINANLNAADFTKYQNYFNLYMSPNYTTYEDANDRVFTITSLSDPSHQNFAIGWPVQGVPEPATWAMMLVGFGGLGAMLRQRKARAAAATA